MQSNIQNTNAPLYNRNNKKNSKISFNGHLSSSPVASNAKKAIDKINSAFEYKGFNMSWLSLLAVSFGGILAPRLLKARDKTERSEILQRDTITILTMSCGANVLNNMLSRACSKKSGFVLLNKPKNSNNIFKKILNFLEPVYSNQLMKSDQLISRYSNVHELKDGIVDFAKFINNENGDIRKVLASDKNSKNITEELFKSWNKNGKIKSFTQASKEDIVSMLSDSKKADNSLIKKLTDCFNGENNNFVKKAKYMNSLFNFLSTFLLVPLLLGYALPKLNEYNTKKIIEQEKANIQS